MNDEQIKEFARMFRSAIESYYESARAWLIVLEGAAKLTDVDSRVIKRARKILARDAFLYDQASAMPDDVLVVSLINLPEDFEE